MGNINSPEINESIETCSVDQKMDNLETRCNQNQKTKEAEYEMLTSLSDLGKHNLEVVKTGEIYFFKVEKQDIILPLGFSLSELSEKLRIINQMLDFAQQHKLKITGDAHGRIIAEDKSLSDTILAPFKGENPHNFLLETGSSDSEKDNAETMFKFAMNTFNIPESNWKIEGNVCKTSNVEICANALGDKSIEKNGEYILAELQNGNKDYIVLNEPQQNNQIIATTD